MISLRIYLLPLPISHKIIPTTNATASTPTHTPALNIPPTTSQLLSNITAKASRPSCKFLIYSF